MASSSLTAQEKMDAWHNGTRGLNVSACGDDKLLKYYEICLNSGYKKESQILKREIDVRKLKVPITTDKKAAELIDYIINHTVDINGKCGKDLYMVKDDITEKLYFTWNLKILDDLISKNYDGFLIDLKNSVIWDENSTDTLSVPIDYKKNMDDAKWFIDHEVFECDIFENVKPEKKKDKHILYTPDDFGKYDGYITDMYI